MEPMRPLRTTRAWPAALLALAMVLAAATAGLLIARGLERFRLADRSITVKGLAERDVKADHAVWTLPFRRAANDFASVQQALARDRDAVVAFLQAQGFEPDEIDARPLRVEDLQARDYAQANQPFRYAGEGRVVVKTARVDAVDAALRASDQLVAAGVPLAGAGAGALLPTYQLRGLNALKGPLLSDATRNAREQAAQFAAEAGAELGRLRSANQGVIQIGGDGSGAGVGDDGGGPDGSEAHSRGKRLRVVSTFVYELR